MADLGFELVLRFLWGSVVVLTLVSRIETSERFLKIATWISVGLGLCGLWLAEESTFSKQVSMPPLLTLLAGQVLYALTSHRGTRIAGFLMILTSPLLFLRDSSFGTYANFISSSVFLGSVFAGQYLGHWFLNVPGLHIREFKKIVTVIIAALISRLAIASWTLFVDVGINGRAFVDIMGRPLNNSLADGADLANLSPTAHILDLSGNVMFGLGFFGSMLLLSRVLWGLVGPIIFTWMVKQTVDARSTQSATGILYAYSVTVLIGEGCALYLQKSLGWLL
jgi:hypothetical protein